LYFCRVDLQNRKSKDLLMSATFNDPKKPTYDVVGGEGTVNMAPNPAYGTSLNKKESVEMTSNPAYATTTATIKGDENPAYV